MAEPEHDPDHDARLAAVDPQRAATAFQRAASASDWSAAIAALDALIVHAPDDASLHYNRALALRLDGRAHDGLAAAERALALEPTHSKATFERGACALESGRPDIAFEASEAFLAASPADVDARLNAARAALLLGRPEHALDHLEGLDGDAATLARGEALRDLGRHDEAETAWRELSPTAAAAVLSLRTKGARGRLRLRPGG